MDTTLRQIQQVKKHNRKRLAPYTQAAIACAWVTIGLIFMYVLLIWSFEDSLQETIRRLFLVVTLFFSPIAITVSLVSLFSLHAFFKRSFALCMNCTGPILWMFA